MAMVCTVALKFLLLLLAAHDLLSQGSHHTVKSSTARLYGGVEVEPKFKYPFMVRFWHKDGYLGKNGSCGGSILNRDWILTAAHCLTRTGDGKTFAVGDHNIFETEETEQELSVKEIILHEKYTDKTDFSQKWDIALVNVKPSIKFSKFVSPVNLPRCKQEPSYPELILSGWGQSEFNNGTHITPALRETNLTRVPLDECKKDIEAEYGKPPFLKHQLCTRIVNGTAAGSGDSGSPLFQLREKDNIHSGYVQVGVHTGPAGFHHGIHTLVSSYVGWIHRRISGCGNHVFSHRLTNGTPGRPTFMTAKVKNVSN